LPTLVHAVPRLVEKGIASGVKNTANDALARPAWALYAGAALGGFVLIKSLFFVRRERKFEAIEGKLDETLDRLEDVSVDPTT
jgi:hypothetical protein